MLPAKIGLVVVLVAAQATAGCSAVFVTPRPPSPVPQEADCTTSKAAPVVDVVLAFVTVAEGTAYTLVRRHQENEIPLDAVAVIAGSAIATILHFASSRYGFGAVEQCRQATGWYERRRAPPALPPQAPPGLAPLGCGRDLDCKGDRICVDGKCVPPTPAPGG